MFAPRVSMHLKPGQRLPKNCKRSWSLCQKTNGVGVAYLVCWFQPRRFVRLFSSNAKSRLTMASGVDNRSTPRGESL